jgi:hypothetical protein
MVTSTHAFGRRLVPLWLIFFLAGGLLGVGGLTPADSTAQVFPDVERSSERSREAPRRFEERGAQGNDLRLQNWARPSAGATRGESSTAYTGPGGVTPRQTPPGDEPEVPVNGGLLWLVLAGMGYGCKRLYDRRPQPSLA